MRTSPAEPRHFETPAEFRAWLKANHAKANELWVGFYKKATGLPSITYPEALDEALCYGWIDGVRKRVDDLSYCQRFTPRRPRSNWSEVNIRKVEELIRRKRMRAPGMRAFEARDRTSPDATPPVPLETTLAPELEKLFRGNKEAWGFFERQPPGCRRANVRWIMSARKPETRQRRLAQLIEASAGGRLA